jgi:valyl-tRNA synthetase
VEENFSRYRISDALMQVYKLFWDDFSGWYLEIIKPEYQKPMDGKTHRATLDFFGTLMKVIHPFMPFITEEIWQRLDKRSEGSSIMVQTMPASAGHNSKLLGRFDLAREIVSAVRTVRKEKNIPNRERLILCTAAGATGDEFDSIIIKMCNLSEIRIVQGQVGNSVSFRIGTSEFYIPLEGTIDSEEELRKLAEELKYTEGFLEIVMSKLSNERFVSNAPEKVLSLERKKQADAEAKIATLKESIARLGK